jgi:hypothetical protein
MLKSGWGPRVVGRDMRDALVSITRGALSITVIVLAGCSNAVPDTPQTSNAGTRNAPPPNHSDKLRPLQRHQLT